MTTTSVNTDFPGYEILAEIGRSNARVVKARHIASGNLVAIKHFAIDTDAETLARFAREADIMTSINHPNVVKIREVNLIAALPFIAMDYVEGGDLRSLMKQRGRLDIPTTVRLGLQMTEALNAIHPAGIVHRDIKPGNILYRTLTNGELHFLLTDFGIARLQDQTNFTKTGQSLMTYDYASPEQFDDPKGVGTASDYYSLGVVLYECLTGKVPFSVADTGLGTFIGRVMREAPLAPTLPLNTNLPASLNTLLLSLLAKKPVERLHEAHELELLLYQANVERLQRNLSVMVVAPEVVVVEEGKMTMEKPVSEQKSNEANESNSFFFTLVIIACVVTSLLVWDNSKRTKIQETTTTVDSAASMMGDSASSTMMYDTAR